MYAHQRSRSAVVEEARACRYVCELAAVKHHRLNNFTLLGLATCAREGCDLTSNLWLCLICGALGCGRQQFGGGGGNGHGLAHTQETGHSVAVKMGTIEPDGTAGAL